LPDAKARQGLRYHKLGDFAALAFVDVIGSLARLRRKPVPDRPEEGMPREVDLQASPRT
jgi:hypothetical protein